MERRSNLVILIDWFWFIVGVLAAMVAVGIFAMPMMVLIHATGAYMFVSQIGGLLLSGAFFWLNIEVYAKGF